MTKLDWKKDLKHLYNPSAKRVSEVVVPPMNFIMIDGYGDPNNAQVFQARTNVLYGLAYTLKFASKQQLGLDYAVMPLEGLWWVEGMGAVDPTTSDRSGWLWTLMIMQPEHITAGFVEAGAETLRRKKNPALLSQYRFERYDEGRAAQVMHLGPYSAEKPTIDRVHAYIAAQGCHPSKKHHEIYLGDPRKTAPQNLKTVIRQPMA